VDVPEVEDRGGRVRVDAGAKAGLHAGVERRDDADDGPVVGVERVGLARLLEQGLAAVDPQVTEHEVVVPEHQGVDVDLGREQRCFE